MDIITKQSINVVKTEGEGKLVYMRKDGHKLKPRTLTHVRHTVYVRVTPAVSTSVN
jgi:hypothetical protein